jgi:hypothetical protein
LPVSGCVLSTPFLARRTWMRPLSSSIMFQVNSQSSLPGARGGRRSGLRSRRGGRTENAYGRHPGDGRPLSGSGIPALADVLFAERCPDSYDRRASSVAGTSTPRVRVRCRRGGVP